MRQARGPGLPDLRGSDAARQLDRHAVGQGKHLLGHSEIGRELQNRGSGSGVLQADRYTVQLLVHRQGNDTREREERRTEPCPVPGQLEKRVLHHPLHHRRRRGHSRRLGRGARPERRGEGPAGDPEAAAALLGDRDHEPPLVRLVVDASEALDLPGKVQKELALAQPFRGQLRCQIGV